MKDWALHVLMFVIFTSATLMVLTGFNTIITYMMYGHF